MILMSNLPALRARAASGARVLDVGGWYHPFNLATHVIDLGSYETRHAEQALDPDDAERFTAETWVVHDVCRPPWPFPDKFFDFVICSHLLEDVRDPLAVCRELVRVGAAGYVETPSRTREIFAKARFFAAKALLGHVPEVGFYHHRWFVEADVAPDGGTHLRFTAKTTALLERRERYITRGDIGRKLTEPESGLGLFWDGGFTAEETFANPKTDYAAFRRRALAALRG
jgi:SAM-dependent methyltransferase